MKARFETLPAATQSRRGSALLFFATVLVLVLAFVAFSVDLGYIALSKSQLQNVADASALGAAMELNATADQNQVLSDARQAAIDVALLNRAGGYSSVILDAETDIELGRRTWDSGTQTFQTQFGPAATPYNIVKVRARLKEILTEVNGSPTIIDRRVPLFFAQVIGHGTAELEVSATATFQPRDMMLVLDYSASMNDDSELRSIYTLGQPVVEAMIDQMWQDLDSPTYGNMQYEPDWVTIPGNKATVTWRTSQVDVTSNLTIQKLRLYFSNGNTKTYNWPSIPGTFQGTGSNSGKRIKKVKVKANGSWETTDFYNNSTIKKGLGLDNVTYPYQSGSWENYIDYARNHSSSMPWYDYDVYAAGYRRKFGMLTLINFWNRKKPKNDQTADLWKVSQQPITALKDAVEVLLEYLTEVEAEDEVGLSVYTYPQGGGGKLESGLTTDLDLLKTISRQRQAGHYDYYTNIGAGMQKARLELENNARPNAFRMMVLMTDGIANRPSPVSAAKQYALDEADLAAASKIKIMTVSLGVNADKILMQDIADRTGGIHFNVPGGSSVSEYEEQLKSVFAEIAADRPLKLID